MAKFAFKATDDYAIRLSKMAAESEEVAKKAIFAAAEIVADQIKSNLQGVLSDEATGELVDSFGVTPITRDNLGNWNVKIGFDDYDSNGVANQLKARVIESGSSTKKRNHL